MTNFQTFGIFGKMKAMNAIEVNGEIDKKGNLLLKRVLPIKDKQVKVIILVEEETDYDDKLWL